MPGPYEHRTALDEVVQMMGGMLGAIGAMAALTQRDHPHYGTGVGQEIQSALFENNVF
ncbi:MAG: crotonobetainyl-CoA:carnitine CoA-transferase CaiB-like acyl-CoA transferase [Litorivivens sp.]